MIAIMALDKRDKLNKEERRIENEKLSFWSQPLDLDAVQKLQDKHQTKVLKLKDEVATYEALIREGVQVETELKRSNQMQRLFACQKALAELNKTLGKAQTNLAKCKSKSRQWNKLKKNWSYINSQELENFRQAKYLKWEAKLNKVQFEKKANLVSISNNIVILSRQALIIVGVASGYGIVVLPTLVNIGLDGFVAGAGITTFLVKRSIKTITISPVDLAQYTR